MIAMFELKPSRYKSAKACLKSTIVFDVDLRIKKHVDKIDKHDQKQQPTIFMMLARN